MESQMRKESDSPRGGTRRGPDRFSARRKHEAAQQLIRGEGLDVVSRELGVTAAALSEWRQTFEAAGQAALKSRPPDERDAENLRLKAKIGQLTMANEWLDAKIEKLEPTHPFPWRKSKP
jgi:transposase-like protein